MSLATFWIEDSISRLSPLPSFTAGTAIDRHELAEINHLTYSEIIDRIDDGHLPYIGRIDDQPVAYGWPQTRYPSANSISMLNSRQMIAISGISLHFLIGRAVDFIHACCSPFLIRKSKTLKGFGSSTHQKISLLASA